MSDKFAIPTEVKEQVEVDPQDLIIIGLPKLGKTAITAELTKIIKEQGRKSLLFCVERGGTDYVSGVYVNIWKDPNDKDRILSITEALENYKGYRDSLLANKANPLDYLIIDNMSDLLTLAEIGGTYYYMYAVTVGKRFNRDKNGVEIPYGHEDFRLVTTLPDGNGYQYMYKWFTDQMDMFSQVAKYRIYLAHVKDKLMKNSNNVEEVKGAEINLTGNLKNIVSKRVTTLAKMLADKNKRFLSFEVDDSNIIAGSRTAKLKGKVLISEQDEKTEKITTYWENIFDNLKSKK